MIALMINDYIATFLLLLAGGNQIYFNCFAIP